MVTDAYAGLSMKGGGNVSERDTLIDAILNADRIQKERIKRLILQEHRLDVLMVLLGYRVAPHHLAFIRFWEHLEAAGINSGLLLGPRGCGKSTVCDICDATLESLCDRNIRILIASRTSDQARAFLGAIKGNLEKPQITEIFGELVGDKWDENQASIRGREKGNKEHTFTVAGADGAVVSKHFNKIYGDDLVEEKNAKTEGQRETVKRFYYRSMIPTLRPGGKIRLLGTRYHPEELYGHLIAEDPMFQKSYFVLPGVFDRETGEAVDLEQKKNGTFALPENAEVWDPEEFTPKIVCERRHSMGQADFEAQYQNRVEFLSGDFFKHDWFRYYSADPLELVKSKGLAVWMGVDLASSLKDSADEFSIVIVGIVPRAYDIYVLDYFAGRLTFNQQKQTLLDMYDKYDPVRSFVEANAYQNVLQATVVEEFPDVRVHPVYTVQDKITRARALQPYYERGQIFHRKGRSAKLEGQLTGFPHVKLKDLFDALYFSIFGAMRGGRRRASRKEEPGLFGG